MNLKSIATKYPKYVYWLVGLLILIVLLQLFKRRKDGTSADALEQLEVNDNALSIDDNKAILIAENLLGAMNRYGTDETAIFANLKNLNKNDLMLVIKKFGVKPYNGAGLATRSYEKKFLSQDLNLLGWLRNELSGNDLEQVKSIFNTNEISF